MVVPNPYRIFFSTQAQRDLFALFGTTSMSGGPAGAFRARLGRSIETLAIFPNRTVRLPVTAKRKVAVRTVAVRPFVVYLRVHEAAHEVEVVTIRHGARRRPRGL